MFSLYTDRRAGVFAALLAALLFGVSTPLVKTLLPEVTPMLMAGLLYLGSGVGLGVYMFLHSRLSTQPVRIAVLTKVDRPWLVASIASGGVIGPVLLMIGLSSTSASSASLLLNLEGAFTAVLAWFVFKEHFDSRIAIGMGLITAGGVCLSWTGQAAGVPLGMLAIVGACFAWAVDNNLTRKISVSDPVRIAMLKGLAAGAVNTSLAVSLGARLPAISSVLAMGVVGFFGYGVSLALFVFALRQIGTARTGAYFCTAPFVGAAISVIILGDHLSGAFVVAAVLMGIGVWLHVTERHDHRHTHEELEHEHVHYHDEHHQHQHSPSDPTGEPHAHPHRHEKLDHRHPHYPDIHHRHQH